MREPHHGQPRPGWTKRRQPEARVSVLGVQRHVVSSQSSIRTALVADGLGSIVMTSSRLSPSSAVWNPWHAGQSFCLRLPAKNTTRPMSDVRFLPYHVCLGPRRYPPDNCASASSMASPANACSPTNNNMLAHHKTTLHKPAQISARSSLDPAETRKGKSGWPDVETKRSRG
jgi:hypothetical protein